LPGHPDHSRQSGDDQVVKRPTKKEPPFCFLLARLAHIDAFLLKLH
jgi:hypothetical protein